MPSRPCSGPEAHRAPSGELTIRKLRAFWAVAHAESLTSAAKLLGIAQPSLSQQIAALEQQLGQQLFQRRSNRMVLTDAGSFLLAKSEQVLRGMQELEDGISAYGGGQHQPLRLAGLESLLRTLLPAALVHVGAELGRMECDLLEAAPAEILEMLYARRADVGLLAANAISDASTGFVQVPIMEDPMMLAVPAALDLACPLTDEGRRVLNASFQIAFGTQHSRRIEAWYNETLPDNRLAARVRSFETALAMVRAGLGVCVVPALAVVAAGGARGLRLYRAGLAPRRVVALVEPAQHRNGRHAPLLSALQAVARGLSLPDASPLPPLCP